jgi:lambda repressor-like predicted transcriptional regulator
MSPNELAVKVGADPKTVGRWLADESRTPHPRHRWAVADALEVDEAVIWPQAVRGTVKTGPDREIVAAYTSRAAVPKAVWRSLLEGAQNSIVFAGYTSYFAWIEIPELVGILRSKAREGAHVRFLLGDPDSVVTRQREDIEGVALTVRTRIAVTMDELRKLHDAPNLQTRFSDRHIAMSVFLFDDQALVCQHLGSGLGHDSPTFHLRRKQSGGLFDRFRDHVEALWDAGRPAKLPA